MKTFCSFYGTNKRFGVFYSFIFDHIYLFIEIDERDSLYKCYDAEC